MIRICSNETKLLAEIDIPPDLNGGKSQHYKLSIELCGSEIAVAALAQRLQHDLDARIKAIREEAYLQGARDRAQHRKHFSTALRTGLGAGGCYF